MKDKYYIVEFKDGVQLVPAKWVDKGEKYCSFPLYDKLRYDQAVKHNEDADQRWKKYKVIRKMGTANTYEDGMIKLSRSEYRSDIDNSTDTEGLPLKKQKTSMGTGSSESMRNFSEYLSQTASNFIRPQSLSLEPSKKFGTMSSSEESEDDTFLHREPFPETPDIGQPSASKTPDISSISTTPSGKKEKKSTKLIKMITKLEFKVDKLQSTLDLFMEKFSEQQIVSIDTIASEHRLPQFPLETPEAVEELDACIADEIFRSILVNELRKLGGKKPSEVVTRQLVFLMSFSLGSQYSYFGTKEKRAFCTLKLCNVVADVVRIFFPAATNEDLKEPIQTWLRHCKERLQKRKSAEN